MFLSAPCTCIFRGGGSGGARGAMAPPLFRQGGPNYQMAPPLFVLQNVKISGIFKKNSPAALNWLYFTQNVRLRLKISCVLRKNFACGAKSVVFYSELLDFHNFCTKIQKFFGGFVPMKPCWTGLASLGRSGPLTIFELPPCLLFADIIRLYNTMKTFR